MSDEKCQLKPGDVVQLKSGGPRMTIDWEDKHNFMCVWFINNELRNGKFCDTSLKLAEESKE